MLFWSHQHGERQLDELFILGDGIQSSPDIISNLDRAAMLDLAGKLMMAG